MKIKAYLSKENKIIETNINFKTCDIFALPGFFDVHIHGGYGYNCFYEDEEQLINFLKKSLYEGTSRILLTTLTSSIEKIESYLKWIKKIIKKQPWLNSQMARIIGIHLEGPFINPQKKGAQNEKYILQPSSTLIKKWQEISGGNIKLITYAPEKTTIEFQNVLNDLGIVGSCGHSMCKSKNLKQFVKKGLSHITHTFNAMSSFKHREIGIVGESFLNDKLNCEIISDGIHVVEDALKILYKNKGCHKIQVITDSVYLKGLPNGEYLFEGLEVIKSETSVRLKTGELAGSISFLNKNVFRMKKILNLNWNQVAMISSINQLREIFQKELTFKNTFLNDEKDYFIFNEALNPLYYVNALGVKKLWNE